MWAVERRVFPQDEEARLIDALRELHVPVREFTGHAFRSDPGIQAAAVPRGSCYFIQWMCSTPGWNRRRWGTVEDYRCSAYHPRIQRWLLNCEYRVLSFVELCWTYRDVYASFGDANGRVFLRPDDGFKPFEGRVVPLDEFERWVEARRITYVRSDTPVVVARTVALYAEWRCVLVRGRVVASSQYRPTFQAHTPAEVRDLAEEVDRETGGPAAVYVIDIAATGEGLRVVEIGCAPCVAFYAADPFAIVRAFQSLVASDENS